MTTAAYAAMSAGAPLESYAIERRSLRSHDVCIDIAYSGICPVSYTHLTLPTRS